MDIQFIQYLTTAVFVSAAASFLGSFVILKRMALVGDALSHVALPGIALGLLLGFNPFLGAFGILFAATTLIWALKYKTNLPTDTLAGIFFTASLAIGVLLIPEHELLEAMLGNITQLSVTESIISILISAALITALFIFKKRLALAMLSDDLAHSAGINNKRLEFAYLLIFAIAVALGIRFVGALLMGALVIIPAAAAKNIARTLSGFVSLSIAFGIVATVAGISVSNFTSLPPGPLLILASVILFAFSITGKISR